MSFTGFDSTDFHVFAIAGLEERMAALIEHIRPKLEAIGEELAPQLSEMVGEEMFPHVAKHARRTVNPPNDTWVAWANNKRGYKQHPHFQVGLWQSHIFVWFALIYESPQKIDFAKQAKPEVNTILETIPQNYVWSFDHMKPETIPSAQVSKKELLAQLERLIKVKQSEILCGIQILPDDPILEDGEAFKNKVMDTFRTLDPLYKLAQPR